LLLYINIGEKFSNFLENIGEKFPYFLEYFYVKWRKTKKEKSLEVTQGRRSLLTHETPRHFSQDPTAESTIC
jgi:3-methyladenine DNA glycosylase AlkC